jgi:hypothetical protein
MGAFDAELARLGIGQVRYREPVEDIPREVTEYRAFLEEAHLVRVACPGSCGSRCPNHYCPSHNGEPYRPRLP